MGTHAETAFDPGLPPRGDLDVELTDEQVEAFERDGYVTFGRITTDEEIEWLRTIYDFLFEEKIGAFAGGYFDLSRPYNSEGDDHLPQIINPETRFPVLRQTLYWRNGRKLAQQLLRCDKGEALGWGHMILKPARHGGELPWHQDEAYWDPEFAYRALGCWTALDDATVDNGCLHFLPGSHRGPVRPHRHIDDDPRVHGLVTDDVDATDEVAIEVPAGSATFHHCRMLHRSGPNTTDAPRRAYANEWQVAPVKRSDGAADRPWVGEGIKAWREAIEARTA